MADTIDICFKSARFNLSEVKDHFINDGCFGEDLAAWMAAKLALQGFQVDEPGQEDWGWYIDLSREGSRWFVGFGGNSDEEPERPNYGEWRVMIKPKRSLKDAIFGKKAPDSLPQVIEDILGAEDGIENVRRES